MDKKIIRSKTGNNVEIYKNVRCVDCTIGSYCSIGDDSDLVNVIMEDYSVVGRRNVIRNSRLGRGTYTGTNTIINYAQIGKYVSIGWNVSFGGANHPIESISLYSDYWFNRTFNTNFDMDYKKTLKGCIVGSDVWIASGVSILYGTKIGNGAVIGAGAVICQDVEPYSVVVGVPGRVIKKRFDDETINYLESIKWWDWNEDRIKANINILRNPPNIEVLKKLYNEEENNNGLL